MHAGWQNVNTGIAIISLQLLLKSLKKRMMKSYSKL